MNDSSAALCRQMASSLATREAFSADALDKAGLCLLDFLACALAARDFPWVEQVTRVAIDNSATGSGGAPVIGTGYRVSIQDAALANAVAGHSLVRDDMHLASVSHLGVVVLPTALALAQGRPVSGRQLLEAIVCGYEAGARLGAMLMDVETAKKIRPTGLVGAFAAAATGARLAGLDSAATANALGFAANTITGLNEWAAWGSDDMYFHPGIAARNGITAMGLAQAGAVAGAGALDGKAGLFAALGKALPAEPLLPFADGEEILAVFFKQVPACNYAQTSAQAALQARQEFGLDAGTVEAVTVAVPRAAAEYPGCDYPGPFNSILQARMSIHFNVASALLHGDFDDGRYRDYANPQVESLAARVAVTIDETLTAAYPARQGAQVTVRTQGREVTASLADVIPADGGDIRERFLAAAGSVLGTGRAGRLAEEVSGLGSAANTRALLSLLVTG